MSSSLRADFRCWEASLSMTTVVGTIPACLNFLFKACQAVVMETAWRFFSAVARIANKIMGVSKWRKIRERDDSVGRVNSRAKALFNLGCGESP